MKYPEGHDEHVRCMIEAADYYLLNQFGRGIVETEQDALLNKEPYPKEKVQELCQKFLNRPYWVDDSYYSHHVVWWEENTIII